MVPDADAIGVAICRSGLAEDIRRYQIERSAAANCGAEKPGARIVSTRSPVPLSRALSRRHPGRKRIDISGDTLHPQSLARGDGERRRCLFPRSSSAGRRAFSTHRAAAAARWLPWWPVPNASAASISMPSLLGEIASDR